MANGLTRRRFLFEVWGDALILNDKLAYRNIVCVDLIRSELGKMREHSSVIKMGDNFYVATPLADLADGPDVQNIKPTIPDTAADALYAGAVPVLGLS